MYIRQYIKIAPDTKKMGVRTLVQNAGALSPSLIPHCKNSHNI